MSEERESVVCVMGANCRSYGGAHDLLLARFGNWSSVRTVHTSVLLVNIRHGQVLIHVSLLTG